MKRSPIKRGDSQLKRSTFKRKYKAQDADTREFRERWRATHPACEIKGPDCTGLTEGIHERQKRSQGGSLNDPRNLVAACNVCNSWVEDNPVEARALGLVVYSYEDLTSDPQCDRKVGQ